MGFSEESIERVKQAADIVEIIGSYIPLKRAGSGFKALSPFNKEKTPSFHVHPQKQFFKDFSSGHSGDVFSFVMLYENVEFPEAVRRVAEKVGIELKEDQGFDRKAGKLKDDLMRVHEALALEYRKWLLERKEAEKARQYLAARDIPLEWVRLFGIGYAPDRWDFTIEWAKKAGFGMEVLEKAGLIKSRETGGYYDTFRGRLMFPIHNEGGRVVAFSGRLLDAEAKAAKYLNSPETPIFSKGRILFGFDWAKRSILEKGYVVICEGQIDVLRCHASGLTHVVAPLGTAFTVEHVRMIRRFTRQVVLCLDADRAGQAAVERAGRVWLEELAGGEWSRGGLGLDVVTLPQGEDPDSLIRGRGVEAFEKLLAERQPFVDYCMDRLKASAPRGVGSMQHLLSGMAAILAQVADTTLRQEYISAAATRLSLSRVQLETEISRLLHRRSRESAGNAAHRADAKTSRLGIESIHPLIQDLLRVMVADLRVIPEVQRRVNPVWIEGLIGAERVLMILQAHQADGFVDREGLLGIFDSSDREAIASLDTGALEGWDLRRMVEAVELVADRLHLDWVQRQLRGVGEALRVPNLDKEKQMELLEQQKLLAKMKKSLTESMPKANLTSF